jgi:tetratricopeptide (TPR) repeat protein
MRACTASQTSRFNGLRAAVLFIGLCGFAFAEAANHTIEQFGEELAQALNDGDRVKLRRLLDLEALGLQVARTLTTNEKEMANFAAGFRKGAMDSLIARTLDVLERTKGSAQFMKVVKRGAELRPLLRLDLGDDGFDYAEYVVRGNAESGYSAVDWYQISTGELISTTVGIASKMLINPDPGWLKSMLGVVEADPDLTSKFRSVGKLEASRKFTEAIAVIESMPKSVAESRVMMVKTVSLAGSSGDQKLYRHALSKLAERHSNDPTTAFLLVDHYVYEGNLEKVLQCIAILEARVGSDGLTELLKANMYYTKSRYDEMIRHAQQAVKNEPERLDGYDTLALGYVSKAQYAKAIETFATMSAKFNLEFTRDDFKDNPAMADFMRSAAFKNWLPAK